MRNKSARGKRRIASIEIGRSQLHVAVCDRTAAGEINVRTDHITWRNQAANLQSESGRDELSSAVAQVISRFRLQSAEVSFTLAGDYCVTRVATGDNDRVRHELSQMQQRSSLYLSLGHGSKAVGGCVRQIDARHQHALLTVVNQRTLDSLVDVSGRSHIELKRIEPSLVALCRCVGRMGHDAEHPVIVVLFSENGAEIGVSHRGQLLLDYRPAGTESHEQVPALVTSQLSRLQRYCDRYVRFARGKLQQIYLAGEAATVQSACQYFRNQPEAALSAEILDPLQLNEHFHWESNVGPTMLPALGTCMLDLMEDAEGFSPNLLENMRLKSRESVLPALIKALWPVAAVLLLAIGAWTMAWMADSRTKELERQVAHYEDVLRQTRLISQLSQRDAKRLGYLSSIRGHLPSVPWDELATVIAKSLPDDMWLESMRLTADGELEITGSSFTEESVYEFTRWLQRSPLVKRADVGGTSPAQVNGGPGTRFNVRCEFNDRNENKGRNNDRT